MEYQSKVRTWCIRAFFAFALMTCQSVFAQFPDSLEIVVIGYGPINETITISSKGKVIFKFKSSSGYKYKTKVSMKDIYIGNNELISIIIDRQSLFGLRKRNLTISERLEDMKQYLVIYTDSRMKRRVMFNTRWSKYEPSLNPR
jgi:hypothetical protein